MSSSNMFFKYIQSWAVVFWIMPEPMQKPFRILLLLYALWLFLNKKVVPKLRLYYAVVVIALATISLHGSFQTPIINILLSCAGVLVFPYFYTPFSERQKKTARRIAFFCCISMLTQLMFYTFEGRPKLSYEMNWGAAYLFLFFLYCDYINFKWGKLFVVLASAVMLSRLLILSLLLYHVILFVKPKIPNIKLSWPLVYTVLFTLFIIMNMWFLLNFGDVRDNAEGRARVTNVADGSNVFRFMANMGIINGIFVDFDDNLVYGYGAIHSEDNVKYFSNYHNMPHNELLDAVAEFGIVTTLIFVFGSLKRFNRLFNKDVYHLYAPLFTYTMILWGRFLIIPSPEMMMVLFLIYSKHDYYKEINDEAFTSSKRLLPWWRR